jgi:MFS family permease
MAPGRERQLLTSALLIAMATVAFEGTVVGAALPSIAGELQGIDLYPWVFSGYLLTTTTTAPLYGKLADIYGRRPLFFVGLGVFTLGTFLCGAAPSMPMLVLARLLQGAGAGAVMPLTLTVLGDIYTIEERVRVQAVTSSLWAFFSVVGPSGGAFVVQYASWRWVFWSNLPFCAAALVLLFVYLRERTAPRDLPIDVAGAVTLTGALTCVLVVSLEGGRSLTWGSGAMAGTLATAAVLFVAFAIVERRAPDPVLPFDALTMRPVAVANLGNVVVGFANFLPTTFVPLLVQGVRGGDALATGSVLTALGAAWSLTAVVSGRIYLALGFRTSAIAGTAGIGVGTAIVAAGAIFMLPTVALAFGMGITGCGLGMCSTAFLYAPQVSVPWNRRAAVTSSTQFARNVAGAIAVAVAGGWLNGKLLDGAISHDINASQAVATVSQMLSPSARGGVASEIGQTLAVTLGDGLATIFVTLALLSGGGLVAMILLARDVKPVGAPPVPDATSQEQGSVA